MQVAEKLQGFGCSVKYPEGCLFLACLFIWKVKLYLSPDNIFWKEMAVPTGLGEGGKSHGSGPYLKFILTLIVKEMQKKVKQRKSNSLCIIKRHNICRQQHFSQTTNNTFIWGDFKAMPLFSVFYLCYLQPLLKVKETIAVEQKKKIIHIFKKTYT